VTQLSKYSFKADIDHPAGHFVPLLNMFKFAISAFFAILLTGTAVFARPLSSLTARGCSQFATCPDRDIDGNNHRGITFTEDSILA